MLKRFFGVLFLGLVLTYLYTPVIAYGFTGFPIMLIFLLGIWSFSGLLKKIADPKFIGQLNDLSSPQALFKRVSSAAPKSASKTNWFNRIPIGIMVLLVLYVTVGQFFTTSPLFHNQSYRNLIGNVQKVENIARYIKPVANEDIRIVDQELASLLGDKVLGSQAALGSQVNLGVFNIQKVKDKLYWVAPLVHSGFFKWLSNRDGTPGYVIISATDERDVKLVQNIDGKPIRIKYQSEAYALQDMTRYLYFNGYVTRGLTDYSFEVDDNGKPYWVITLYRKTIGFAGDDAVGVAVLDAQSGAIQEYDINHAPAWVDRIQPSDFVEKQFNDWGNYVNGYWNFSNEGKLQVSETPHIVYGDDRKSYWYTSLTSVGADESTVGFVLVDTRTKKAVWYKQSGATEFAAQNSAMGKVQEKGYQASVAIPYNINGIPTYAMTLKDKGGLIKMYAMVAIEDYTIVGAGTSMQEAISSYKNAYNMTGKQAHSSALETRSKLKSVVERINNDVKNGNTFYYFMVKGNPNIFVGTSQISNKLPLTLAGDSVEVVYDNDVQSIIDISGFENKKIGK
jgi:hypothetical protein